MPKKIKELGALQVDKAKPGKGGPPHKDGTPRKDGESYSLFDGGGLFLLVTPTGSKWWRFKYTYGGKSKLLSFGTYPDISLADARDKRHEARNMLAKGIDPGEQRKSHKAEIAVSKAKSENTFGKVALDWLKIVKPEWTEGHAVTVESRLNRDVIPWIGKKSIIEITSPEVLEVLKRVESRQAFESAHRIKTIISQVFNFAIASGLVISNPAVGLSAAMVKPCKKNMSAILDPSLLAQFLRDIDGYMGMFATICALKLMPMLFLRIGELRHGKWKDVDLDAGIWHFPAEELKGTKQEKAAWKGQIHAICLSSQAIAVLRELYPLTGAGLYIFKGRSAARPISENTINSAMRTMGYDEETVTGHGFRTTARTMLHETLNFTPDAIEAQLAHKVPDRLGTAYNRAKHLPERQVMMQAWSDYLEQLKAGAKILPFSQRAVA